MGRIMAIDYGDKRCGIAVTDPLQMIASPLITSSTHEIFEFLKNYFAKEQVDSVVIGDPRRLNNTSSDTTERANHFVNRFKRTFPGLKVERFDERFTSKIASQSLIDSGQRKKVRSDKQVLDQVSATLILQDYLALQKQNSL